MPAFSALVKQPAALLPVALSAPIPAGRFQGDPVRWTGVAADTIIRALATGSVTTVKPGKPAPNGPPPGIPGDPSAPWTLFELSPLPQMAPAAFKALAGGLPVLLVVVRGAVVPGPALDDLLIGGQSFVTAPKGTGATAFFALAFQDRLCRAPLTWAEAIAATGEAEQPAWAQFVTDLGALPGARRLTILDHVGRPKTHGIFAVSTGGPATSVTLTAASDGDTGVVVPPTSHITLTYSSAVAPIVAAAAADDGAFQAPLTLAAGSRLAQALDADPWFAWPDAWVELPRWNPDSHVEPIVDGNPYFARLVKDLRSAKGGGAVGFAGWAFVKGSLANPDTVDWPLVPGAADTILLALVQELIASAPPPPPLPPTTVKFLVNQFLQFDVPELDDLDVPILPGLLLATYASLMTLQTFNLLATDPAGFVVASIPLTATSTILTTSLGSKLIKSLIEHVAEISKPMVDELLKISPDMVTLTPYPAAFVDNPLVPQPVELGGLRIDDLSHLGVYHQKLVNIRSAAGAFVSYLGGIDLNSDRVDDPLHRAIHPFHDVQVRITGPATKNLIQTYAERAAFHGATAPMLTPDAVAAAGSHLVQIARTYFKPAAGSTTPAFPFAPNGETTTVRTLKAAIAAARDFIYIEDQYLTPPDDYIQALLDAAKPARGVRALVITVPYQTDQLYGGIRRADVIKALTDAWGPRLHVGTPLRRFLHPTPARVTNLGRLRLTKDLTADEAGPTATLGPEAHLPDPPFWCFVGGELLLVTSKSGEGPDLSDDTPPVRQQKVFIQRAGQPGWGAQPLEHPKGTPVLCVQIPGIYVHAKVMIVDDMFLSVGSANLNRRSLYHDGELNSFTLPQHLKGDPANPARRLRCRLWAEHLGLPPEMGLSLLADPLSAISLFTTRSWYNGSHLQPLSFFGPTPLDVGLGTNILKLTIGGIEEELKPQAWRLLVDPTTELEPQPPPRKNGPGYP
ncbi:MAG TPA: phospholipase D-like domain-containing protein [Thermoanaerobaculia bacterium]|nr:phospholipase D-like domain-containing protein [Thermoanaerobaculia bacterium]